MARMAYLILRFRAVVPPSAAPLPLLLAFGDSAPAALLLLVVVLAPSPSLPPDAASLAKCSSNCSMYVWAARLRLPSCSRQAVWCVKCMEGNKGSTATPLLRKRMPDARGVA